MDLSMIDATYCDRGNDVDISGESIPDDRDSLRRWAPTRTCLSGRWLPGQAARLSRSPLPGGKPHAEAQSERLLVEGLVLACRGSLDECLDRACALRDVAHGRDA